MRTLRMTLFLSIAILLPFGGGSPATAQASTPSVMKLRLDGVVDPFVAAYVEAGIERAQPEAEGHAAVLLSIDTPGGLDSAMRTIVQAILDSEVPVICYTEPAGARAASAGAFVMLACPLNAMAPGTNIGAAHPVGLSGAIELSKAENDAAAYIRSLAELHGRNADWAERAVRESVSATAQEALDLGVVDLVADDVPALLAAVDDRSVTVADGREVVLRTTGLTVEARSLGWIASVLHTLLDPNLTFLFFYAGIALIALELFVPGGVLGVTGGILLALSVIALGMLPVDLLGVVLLLASVAFFLLELKLPGTAVGTGAGLVTLVAGGLLLFDRSVPTAGVSPWVIGPVAIGAALFFAFVLRAAMRAFRSHPVTGVSTIVGAEGVAVTDLTPSGVILANAEEWSAESLSGPLPRGTKVVVMNVEGLRVRVVPAVSEPEPATAARGAEREGGTE